MIAGLRWSRVGGYPRTTTSGTSTRRTRLSSHPFSLLHLPSVTVFWGTVPVWTVTGAVVQMVRTGLLTSGGTGTVESRKV